MKKSLYFLLGFLIFLGVPSLIVNAIGPFTPEQYVGSTEREDFLDGDRIDANNPIREGMQGIINSPTGDDTVEGVITGTPIQTHNQAVQATMHLIQIVINYSLALLGFVALIYIIYSGFLIFTAGTDDKQQAKGKSGIKIAIIALAGIAVAWLIVSFILWLITLITS